MGRGSIFRTKAPEFVSTLQEQAADWDDPNVLVSRNFLLDENVLPIRADSYISNGAGTAHSDSGEWETAHNKYLVESINCPGHSGIPGDSVDPTDPDACAETFRQIDPASPYQWADDQLHLIRVEQISFVSRSAGESPDRIRQLLDSYIQSAANPDLDIRQQLDAVLDTWISRTDSRPVFAAFWDDVCDLFGDTPDEDTEHWADELRDRLGLLHLNPSTRGGDPIDVIIFRYPIADTPRLRGIRERRPLVPPTVLDGRFSPPFCPAPVEEKTGFTVHLCGECEPLRQEVLHPRLAFQTKHLWRVGQIGRSIMEEKKTLAEARAFHLAAVRDRTGRNDYAADTDGDLL